MKALFPILAFALLLSPCAWSQAKERKTLTFQPGAKTPDQGTPAATPPAAATPAAATARPAVTDEPGKITAAFFDLVQKGMIDEAYAALTRGSKIAERPEEVSQLKAKTEEAVKIFGAITGSELIETKTVGENLMRRTYLTLGGDFPLRWRFYFYRGQGVWRLVDLRVDDRLAGIFEEAEEAAASAAKPSAAGKQ